MGKRQKSYKSHKRGGGRFSMMTHDVINSPAFLDLSPVARAVYIEVKKRYNGKNNGSIGLGVREAGQAIKRSRSVAHRAFHELKDHGFIQVKTPSSFDQKNLAVEWLLTEYVDDTTGSAALKTFREWDAATGTLSHPAAKQKSVPLAKPSVPPAKHNAVNPARTRPDSPAGDTVVRNLDDPQSHGRDTYISTPEGDACDLNESSAASQDSHSPLSTGRQVERAVRDALDKAGIDIVQPLPRLDEAAAFSTPKGMQRHAVNSTSNSAPDPRSPEAGSQLMGKICSRTSDTVEDHMNDPLVKAMLDSIPGLKLVSINTYTVPNP